MRFKLQDAFQQAVASVSPMKTDKVSVTNADPRFGDYQCNNAMGIFKWHKQHPEAPQFKSPKDCGEAIKGALPLESSSFIDTVTVSPQGFVTVTVRQSWLEDEIRNLYRSKIQYHTSTPQKIVIDYSSPNIAKEMHVGHLRSTILGDTIANLLEWLGHDVLRLNHVGDWGTQFGMLLEYMRQKGCLNGNSESSELLISDLQTFYRDAKKFFDTDPDFRKSAQENVVALQSGEAWARKSWESICAASRTEFADIYGRLNIQSLQERGESYYNPMLPSLIQELTEIGLVEENGGAKCIFTNVSEAPLIVQKADGGYGYDSTDCAAVLHRIREEDADRIIYVIDNGQEMHMRMVFEVAQRAGWVSAKETRLDFMGFGLVQGEDGKKFKTRSGDVVKLRDLLDEATSRAEAELQKRYGANEGNMQDEAQLHSNAELIGVAAVKYFDLRQNRNSNYRFSYDAMLDPKGNTAIYVLYAYARIAALLKRSTYTIEDIDPGALKLSEPSERALGLQLVRLPEVLRQLEDDLLPSGLILYVYELANAFSAFYTECPVVGTEAEASRIVLCKATQRVFDLCLQIIGVKPLEKL